MLAIYGCYGYALVDIAWEGGEEQNVQSSGQPCPVGDWTQIPLTLVHFPR
jgi:hypothetical protein